MINVHHKKIAIIGCAGSGKTTLAFQLHKKLNLPLYHLDQYYWKPQWHRSEFEEFSKVHAELCEQEAWIMEGSYYRLFYERACHADIIIYLDLPRCVCLWNVIKRAAFNWGKILPGSPDGCKQEFFTLNFVKFLYWVWTFNKRYQKDLSNAFEALKVKKQVYVLKSFKEQDIITFKLKI